MPPKGARGRAARGGRGSRGRGGSAAAAAAAAPASDVGQEASQAAIDNVVGQETSQAAIGAPNLETATNKSPENGDQPSPNSSPVSVPTETPAPTPIVPNIPETNTTAPTTSTSRGRGLSARGASSTRGRGDGSTATKSKFKPKAIRRDQSERDRLAQEAEEKSRRDREYAERGAMRAARARGRGGRGRGDAMGRGTLLGRGGGSTGVASGPFSMAPDDVKRPGIGFGSFGGPSMSSGGSGEKSGGSGITRVKTEGGVSGGFGGGGGGGGGRSGAAGENYFFEPHYPDEEDGPRIDIERINLISDDDDDDPIITGQNKINKGKGKAVSSKGGLRPVRLDRHEHKDRVAVVNTDPEVDLPGGVEEDDKDTILIDKDSTARPLGATLQEREWKGVYPDEEDTKVKSEPGTVPMDLDSIPTGEFKPNIEALDAEPTPAPETISPKAKTKRSNSQIKKRKEKKPVLQTEEDKAEYKRHLEDVAILANELGGMQARGSGSDGDGNVDGDEQAEVDKKEGRLYLFQFPPILPPLRNPAEDPDVEVTGANTTTKENLFVKLEGQEEVVIKSEEKDGNFIEIPEELVTEQGFLGKLVVRKSGKVELNWGGTSLVVGRGIETSFLSTVVVVDERKGMEEGVAMGMGKVMGKFVVTPDLDKMM